MTRPVFQGILEGLLRETGASRTTLRLDQPGEDFPVVAEALSPGTRAIQGDARVAVRDSETFRFFERERRPLIVEDCRASDPPTPEALMEFYGVRAEMLAPLIDAGRIVGIVSVHYAPGPRQWTALEIAALDEASRSIMQARSRT
jgi:maleate isomerase